MREFSLRYGVKVSDEDLAAIVCTGLECGSYASLGIHHFEGDAEPPDWAQDDRDYRHLWAWSRDGSMFVFARHEDEQPPLELNREGLVRAVRAHFAADPSLYRDAVFDGRVDPGALDAIQGDAILQRAVFGQVVYA